MGIQYQPVLSACSPFDATVQSKSSTQPFQAQLESLMEFDERVHDTLWMSPCIQILISVWSVHKTTPYHLKNSVCILQHFSWTLSFVWSFFSHQTVWQSSGEFVFLSRVLRREELRTGCDGGLTRKITLLTSAMQCKNWCLKLNPSRFYSDWRIEIV